MLNNIGLPGLLLIVVVTVILFGRGKVSTIMGELGTGITAFKKGIREAEQAPAEVGAQDTPDTSSVVQK